MKVIIPMGGKGTRLKPHTYTRPKPLVHVAGKPVLGHILDQLKGLAIDEMIFITGSFSEQIQAYVASNYSFNARFIAQKDALGVAHAISLAKEFITDDVLIVFADTLFEADSSVINALTSSASKPVRSLKTAMGFSKKIDADGVFWVKEVEDPRRFGVAFLHEGIVSKIIEKPQTPVSNLALIGLYYVSHGRKLMDAIDYIITHNITFKNEFFLTDALQLMIEQGEQFIAKPVDIWLDCGTVESLLETNRHLLQHGAMNAPKFPGCVIVPPVFIEPDAQITNSIIGPFVSIATGAAVKNSIIRNSILNHHATIVSAILEGSLVGSESVVKEVPKKLNMGDSSEIILSQEPML